MQAVDLSRPGERKKLIWAGVLGFVALIFLWWTFFGFGSSKPTTPTRTTTAPSGPGSRTAQAATASTQQNQPAPPAVVRDRARFSPIVYHPSSYSAPDVKRNIFAYYVPPKPTPAPVSAEAAPSPTPPPPLLLASISLSNVYARSCRRSRRCGWLAAAETKER